MAPDVRTRILAATEECLGRYGLAKTTVDDVARTAGLARATVYRHFPQGKDQVIAEGITWAVGQFFVSLAEAVGDDGADFATWLERALMFAHQSVEDHEVLQKVLQTEPERLLPQLTQSVPQVRVRLSAYLSHRLESEHLRDGIDPVEAGEWLARMGLSFIVSGGSWDLSDAEQVRRLVRGELLAAVLADSPT